MASISSTTFATQSTMRNVLNSLGHRCHLDRIREGQKQQRLVNCALPYT